ncbi:hypothetical protein RhiirA4_476473 [Rhizophagus irregularis]|uniref:Uncharacterized protein n=1 Tax=Rhizophagus irregularis TaxID=588596 RepID=A0A2I1HBP1_9GLOM|nr:hypothetical protein RhiirA4_476473 [Rhizophagus irregularis]
MALKLDTFTLSSLTLKATYNNINSNEVVELREKDRLDQIITCEIYNNFKFLFNLTTTWYLANGIISPKLVYGITVVFLSPNGIAKTEFQEFDKLHLIEYYMAGGVPRYIFWNVKASIKDVVGNKKEILNAEEKEKIEKQAYNCIELVILKIDNFDKIIKCFTEDEKSCVEISNRIIHR